MVSEKKQVLHVEKRLCISSGLNRHNTREEWVIENGKYVRITWTPENGDPTRTHLCKEFFSREWADKDGEKARTHTIQNQVDRRIKELHLKKKLRRDAVTSLEIILTGNNEVMNGMDEPTLMQWAEDSIKWAKDTFGERNVVNAMLHRDEEAPHLHLIVVPITKTTSRKSTNTINKKDLAKIDKLENQLAELQESNEPNKDKENKISSQIQQIKKTIDERNRLTEKGSGEERLCCNDVYTQSHLYKWHDTYFEQVGAKYGLFRGEKAVETGEKKHHKDAKAYKRELAQMEKELEKMNTEVALKTKEVAALKKEKEDSMREECTDLQKRCKKETDDIKETARDNQIEFNDEERLFLIKSKEQCEENLDDYLSYNELKEERDILKGLLTQLGTFFNNIKSTIKEKYTKEINHLRERAEAVYDIKESVEAEHIRKICTMEAEEGSLSKKIEVINDTIDKFNKAAKKQHDTMFGTSGTLKVPEKSKILGVYDTHTVDEFIEKVRTSISYADFSKSVQKLDLTVLKDEALKDKEVAEKKFNELNNSPEKLKARISEIEAEKLRKDTESIVRFIQWPKANVSVCRREELEGMGKKGVYMQFESEGKKFYGILWADNHITFTEDERLRSMNDYTTLIRERDVLFKTPTLTELRERRATRFMENKLTAALNRPFKLKILDKQMRVDKGQEKGMEYLFRCEEDGCTYLLDYTKGIRYQETTKVNNIHEFYHSPEYTSTIITHTDVVSEKQQKQTQHRGQGV